MKQSIIVIGSNPATKLSLIRCVGAVEGCRVTVVDMVFSIPKKIERTIDSCSKYVDRVLYALKYDADGLAQLLMEKCRTEGEKPIIMSVDDDSACLIDTIQDKIRNDFLFSHINNQAGAIAELMDKSKQKQLAKACGFDIAESWPVDCVEGSYTIPDEVRYPCYVKGRLSYRSEKRYQKKCKSREELEKWLQVLAAHNHSPLLIEEFIEIDKDYGVIGFSDTSKVILPGIVELFDCGKGSARGVAVYGEVNDFGQNETLKPKIEQMMQRLQLIGLFNIDLVTSHGKWYFVEINMRFAAYGYAVCKAGVNLPAFQIYSMLSMDDSCLSTHVKNGFRYVNERGAFNDVAGGFRTLKEYRNMLKEADCRLIFQDDDPEPYRQFRKGLAINYLKTRIKEKLFGGNQ